MTISLGFRFAVVLFLIGNSKVFANDVGGGGSTGGGIVTYDQYEHHHGQGGCWKETNAYRVVGPDGVVRTLTGSDIAADCQQINKDVEYYSSGAWKQINSELSTPDQYGRVLTPSSVAQKIIERAKKQRVSPQVLLSAIRSFKNIQDIPFHSKNKPASLTEVTHTSHVLLKSLAKTEGASQFACNSFLLFVDLTAPVSQPRFHIVDLTTGSTLRAPFLNGGPQKKECLRPSDLEKSRILLGHSLFIGGKSTSQVALKTIHSPQRSGEITVKEFLSRATSVGALPDKAFQTLKSLLQNAEKSCRPSIYFYPESQRIPASEWHPGCRPNGTSKL